MNVLEKLVSVYAPHCCLICDRSGAPVCNGCWPDIGEPAISACYVCAKRTKDFAVCVTCARANRPTHVWAATEYGGVVEQLIKGLKYHHRRAYGDALARLLDQTLPYNMKPIVCAVPTTTVRKRQRGYDHAVLIAKKLVQLREWQFSQLLTRLDQSHQVGANREQRRGNSIDHRVSVGAGGAHILLVDDVLSTGSSIEAATEALFAAGARQIDAVTVAVNRAELV